MTPLPPRPTYIYGSGVRHIGRPDHPHGVEVTDVAFCGAFGDNPAAETNLRVCRRCSESWFGWLERLAEWEGRAERARIKEAEAEVAAEEAS